MVDLVVSCEVLGIVEFVTMVDLMSLLQNINDLYGFLEEAFYIRYTILYYDGVYCYNTEYYIIKMV